jgi:riboflavin synthase
LGENLIVFTGLVDSQVTVLEHSFSDVTSILVIESPYNDVVLGESISINGVCLTVLEHTKVLKFSVSSETLACSNLKCLKVLDMVNTERAMLANSRFGGHIVLGHVDTAVIVQNVNLIDGYKELSLGPFSEQEMLYVVPKGSVSINGVSLTINALTDNHIKIMLIPHTLEHTNLAHLSVGSWVNVEFDYFAKIIAHQFKAMSKTRAVGCD